MAEIDELRVRLQAAERERYWLRDEVKALKKERGALVAAGDALAEVVGLFWEPHLHRDNGELCSMCEVELFGLLDEQLEAWLLLRGGDDE